jgi:hypothetical protein
MHHVWNQTLLSSHFALQSANEEEEEEEKQFRASHQFIQSCPATDSLSLSLSVAS